jgi:hypothetical protein
VLLSASNLFWLVALARLHKNDERSEPFSEALFLEIIGPMIILVVDAIERRLPFNECLAGFGDRCHPDRGNIIPHG